MKSSLSSLDFKRVLRNGYSIKFNSFKFTYRKSFKHVIGFTVSKKYGNAVERNILKRQCRSIYKDLFINSIYDYSLIVSPVSYDISWEKIKLDFNKLIEHINDK